MKITHIKSYDFIIIFLSLKRIVISSSYEILVNSTTYLSLIYLYLKLCVLKVCVLMWFYKKVALLSTFRPYLSRKHFDVDPNKIFLSFTLCLFLWKQTQCIIADEKEEWEK